MSATEWQLWCRVWDELYERFGWTRWHNLGEVYKTDQQAFKRLEDARSNADVLAPRTKLEYDLRRGTA